MKKIILFIGLIPILTWAQSPAFSWAKRIGGDGGDVGNAIATDDAGNIFLTGSFRDTVDFDPGPGVVNRMSKSNSDDIFIVKMDADGNLLWVKVFSGEGTDLGNSIAVDKAGYLYITGIFNDTVDFDPGPGVYELNSGNTSVSTSRADIFILKLDTSGNFVWVKKVGSPSDDDFSSDIALDSSGNVYVTGNFTNTVDFDPGPGVYYLTAANYDNFILKLTASGNYSWAKAIEGQGNDDKGISIDTDSEGNVYTVGVFRMTADFDPGVDSFELTSAGNFDIYVSMLDRFGNFVWAKRIGGTDNDEGQSIVIDGSGNAIVTGNYAGVVDLNPGSGVMLTQGGSFGTFVLKLNQSGIFVWAKDLRTTEWSDGYTSATDKSGNIYVGGEFVGKMDLNPGIDTFFIRSSSGGHSNGFIVKLDGSGNFAWGGHIEAKTTISASKIKAIAVANDKIYTTGYFSGEDDFDPTSGVSKLNTVNYHGDIFIMKMTQQAPTDIKDIARQELILYPNPTSGLVTIFAPSIQNSYNIEVYNHLGILIHTQSISKGQGVIDLRPYDSGLYIVRMISNNEVISCSKIIKH